MKSQVIRLTTLIGAAVLVASAAQAQANYSEGFEAPAFTIGVPVDGINGWGQWNTTGVTDNSVLANPNPIQGHGAQSLANNLHADKVHSQTFSSGHWNWSVWSYVPAATQLPQWAVFLSTYVSNGTDFWNAQVELDPSLGQISADLGPNAICGGTATSQFFTTAPLVVGSWTQLRLDIDLTSDKCQCWYNNKPVGQVFQWTDGITAGFGLDQIETIDLYANDNTVAGDRMYWDDVQVTANTNPAPQCLGVGIPYCTAGTSLSGCTPVIASTGVASASATSGFTITLSAGEGNKQGLLFYGISGQLSAPWGTGINPEELALCKRRGHRTPAMRADRG